MARRRGKGTRRGGGEWETSEQKAKARRSFAERNAGYSPFMEAQRPQISRQYAMDTAARFTDVPTRQSLRDTMRSGRKSGRSSRRR